MDNVDERFTDEENADEESKGGRRVDSEESEKGGKGGKKGAPGSEA